MKGEVLEWKALAISAHPAGQTVKTFLWRIASAG